jgi:hypothetical protein
MEDFLIKFSIFADPFAFVRGAGPFIFPEKGGPRAVSALLWDRKTVFSFFLHIVSVKT